MTGFEMSAVICSKAATRPASEPSLFTRVSGDGFHAISHFIIAVLVCFTPSKLY